MNLSRDGLSIANMFLMASVRLNLLNRTIVIRITSPPCGDLNSNGCDYTTKTDVCRPPPRAAGNHRLLAFEASVV